MSEIRRHLTSHKGITIMRNIINKTDSKSNTEERGIIYYMLWSGAIAYIGLLNYFMATGGGCR
jgi:hypothetical protein